MAHACSVSVEAEVGSVAYNDPNIHAKAIFTEPEEAQKFVNETNVDALAIAVGTMHKMQSQVNYVSCWQSGYWHGCENGFWAINTKANGEGRECL